MRKNATADNSYVVLGDQTLVAYDSFFFYTKGAPYPVKYWTDFGFLQGGQLATAEEIEKWETEILRHKDKIFYIFSPGPHFYEMPGPIVWYPPTNQRALEELHPDIFPSKTIYHTSGIPALLIYTVTKDMPSYSRINYPNPTKQDQLSSDKQVIAIGGQEIPSKYFAFAPKATVKEVFSLNSDTSSWIRYYPLYQPEEQAGDFYFANNMSLNNTGQTTYWSNQSETHDGSFLIYQIKFPFNIDEISIQTNPRIFNDKKGKNLFSIAYSLDGNKYTDLLKLISDKSGRWTDPNYRQTYNRLEPKNKNFYLKLSFQGNKEEIQLWPNPVYPLLEVIFNLPELPKITIGEFAKLGTTRNSPNGKIVLYTKPN